jgi:SmpA / OmlA family
MNRLGPMLLLAAAVGAPLAGYAQEQGYLCCNLRSDGSWISDSNYLRSGKTMIPFGTPVQVTGQGRYRVHLEIDGRRQAIGNDYSRTLTMDEFQRRYVVPEDPHRLVAGLPARVRSAIETMRVTPGMTRSQVAIAIGWPITSENPQLDAKVWKYWLWTFAPFDVVFDDNGRVRSVETDPETLAKVFVR